MHCTHTICRNIIFWTNFVRSRHDTRLYNSIYVYRWTYYIILLRTAILYSSVHTARQEHLLCRRTRDDDICENNILCTSVAAYERRVSAGSTLWILMNVSPRMANSTVYPHAVDVYTTYNYNNVIIIRA